jgi:RNA polymerase sigma factor (sigma-70 family)
MPDQLGDAASRDSELVRAAQAGDAGSLGLLLTRHRAGMHAVALALLGHSADAEDAVQEAALVAPCRIRDLRDPDAVGPWLRMVVRNTCRAQLRKVSAVPMAEPTEAVARVGVADSLDPARLLEQHALRDWIWTALEGLSPALRLVTLLRYFTEVSSYADIAAVCATPVGTVRSRLSLARTKLADALRAAADQAYGDPTALHALHRDLGEQALPVPLPALRRLGARPGRRPRRADTSAPPASTLSQTLRGSGELFRHSPHPAGMNSIKLSPDQRATSLVGNDEVRSELHDSGHFVHIEEPDGFAEAVVDFVYDIKAGERA